MSTEHDDRAQRGATLLDEKMPGWPGKVALSTLRMSSARYCILGQTYGDYFTGARELFADNGAHCGACGPDCADHGFYDSTESGDYAPLEDAWRRIIEQRRNEWAQTLIEQGWYPSRDGLYMISPSTGAAVAEDGCRIEPLAPVAA